MNVLLSIRPEYIQGIACGAKRYEFRKTIFRNETVDKVYIYSTAPVKKIVGAFTIGEIIEGTPSFLWRNFKNESGLARHEFFDYFGDRARGYAIGIEDFNLFDHAIDPWLSIQDFYPPQSFWYFDDRMINEYFKEMSNNIREIPGNQPNTVAGKGVMR
jgi:predicted transcriptional regulator